MDTASEPRPPRGDVKKRTCFHCGGDHWSRDCPKRVRRAGDEHLMLAPHSAGNVFAETRGVSTVLNLWTARRCTVILILMLILMMMT